MAKVSFTSIVSSAAGSLAGSTFKHSRYGSLLGRKGGISAPRQLNNQQSRAVMSNVSKAWRSLPAANKREWHQRAPNDLTAWQFFLQRCFLLSRFQYALPTRPLFSNPPAAGYYLTKCQIYKTQRIDIFVNGPANLNGFQWMLKIFKPVPSVYSFRSSLPYYYATPKSNLLGNFVIVKNIPQSKAWFYKTDWFCRVDLYAINRFSGQIFFLSSYQATLLPK